ncbi:MAG TPA: glycosyl hydrolase family 28 protein [Terriglobia bacterium]|nr:glycosyl hydrolase family 28 protein [Terriglobia bacterium]
MIRNRAKENIWIGLALFFPILSPPLCAQVSLPVFNVRHYGATGKKQDNAQAAIQQAVDACAQAGGGIVNLPPGEYSSGTIHLRSHVRFRVEAGATLFASPDTTGYDKASLLYGKDLQDISIEGRGTIDGQGAYDWRLNDLDDAYIRDNQLAAQAAGASMMRSFPRGYPTRKLYPHMILLLRCKDVFITGLSFLRSPSWTINPYACERLTIDGIYIHTSLKDGVWADGIDPDGCKDVRISNSTIETGDDAIVFYSSTIWGAALPCENITITNCRLSSASSALKFCDGNSNAVRNVTVDNCVITGSNRGIAFMVYDGGIVENVVLSNLIVNCHRFDWFWWGNGDPIYFTIQRRSESLGKLLKPDEPPAGSIRNVIIRNVIAHGEGSCLISGHRDSWLDHVNIENIKFYLSTDPAAAYDRSVNAMQFRYAKNLTVKDVEVIWEKPELAKWQSALYFEDITGLRVDGFSGGPAKPETDTPAIVLNQVRDATISNSRALPGTKVYLAVRGLKSGRINLVGNDLHGTGIPFRLEGDAKEGAVKALYNY